MLANQKRENVDLYPISNRKSKYKVQEKTRDHVAVGFYLHLIGNERMT